MNRQTVRMSLLMLCFTFFPLIILLLAAPAPALMNLNACVINLSVRTIAVILRQQSI